MEKEKKKTLSKKSVRERQKRKTGNVFGKEKIILPKTKVKIIGLGGGGNSIVADLSSNLKGVQFVAANTDWQALRKTAKKCKPFFFGEAVTRHLGTGMDPDLGELAAQKERERIEKLFEGTDLTILIATLGGGTGSGALPVFAQAARKAGSSVLGIFTLPFKFEGEKKANIARKSLEKTEPFLQGLILIANEKIFNLVDKNTPLQSALSYINNILNQSLGAFLEVFSLPGLVNIDFSDLKTILKGKEKLAYLHSVEIGSKEDRATTLSQLLFENPLYESLPSRPKRVLFNIAGGKDLKISEVEKIGRAVYEKNPRAKIIFGLSQSPRWAKKIRVTVLALGEREKEKKARPKRKKVEREVKKEKIKPEIVPKESKQKPSPKIPSAQRKEKQISLKLVQVKKGSSKKEKQKSSPQEKKVKKKKAGKKKKIKRKAAPPKTSSEAAFRRNALDLKEEIKKEERELLEKEAQWDRPAFLRRKI